MEPATKGAAINYCDNCRDDGFVMGFRARVVEVSRDDSLLVEAMARTRAIFDLRDAPDGAPGCLNCGLVLDLAEQLWPGIADVDLVAKLRRMLEDPALARATRAPGSRTAGAANVPRGALARLAGDVNATFTDEHGKNSTTKVRVMARDDEGDDEAPPSIGNPDSDDPTLTRPSSGGSGRLSVPKGSSNASAS